MQQTSPFNLNNTAAYLSWRTDKLANYPILIDEIMVDIANPYALTDAEKQALTDSIQRCNMVIYRVTDKSIDIADKEMVASLGRQFGLQHLDNNLYADEDAISSLKLQDEPGKKGYIPYTNRPIAWHTDGYYNSGSKQIRAMVLHCVRPAEDGGSNKLLDHEIAYIKLRDRNPEFVRALSKPDAMGIPANDTGGEHIRDAVTGPVFSVDSKGNLHMRYTARTRSIEWSQDEDVQLAKDALEEILITNSPYHFSGKLQAGEGLLCNNVLHTRTKFNEGSQRLLYRGRYFDRIDL